MGSVDAEELEGAVAVFVVGGSVVEGGAEVAGAGLLGAAEVAGPEVVAEGDEHPAIMKLATIITANNNTRSFFIISS